MCVYEPLWCALYVWIRFCSESHTDTIISVKHDSTKTGWRTYFCSSLWPWQLTTMGPVNHKQYGAEQEVCHLDSECLGSGVSAFIHWMKREQIEKRGVLLEKICILNLCLIGIRNSTCRPGRDPLQWQKHTGRTGSWGFAITETTSHAGGTLAATVFTASQMWVL